MTIDTSANNKRIAKNTLFLYLRQLVTMAVSLYTVRVVLDVLGAEDYGIYNVIGGIVALFSFLSGTMASATQRFLSYAMGKGERESMTKVFSVSMYIYILMVTVVLAISETIGLWFVNNRLTIPGDRMVAANFVYQSAIFSFIVTLLCIPYNASIIAMERMNVFAYSSIVDAFLKLAIAWALPFIAADHLKAYAVLMFVAISAVQVYFLWYCRRYFDFCAYKRYRDQNLSKSILSFAGWNMIGALANILRAQGLNILINMFFNPVINAAYSIALQVSHAVTNFTNNFYTAVRPQLVMLYAGGNNKEMLKLGYQSTRFAFYLMLIISIPLLLNTEEILAVWLKEVPDYTVLFLRLIVIASLIEVLAIPLANMIQASGNVKLFQLTVSLLYLLNIPISYILLYMGCLPEITLWVNTILISISMIPRLYICRKILQLSIKEYVQEVLLKISFPSLLAIVLFAIAINLIRDSNAFLGIAIEMGITALLVWLLGITSHERMQIKNTFINKFKKHD